MIGKIPFLMNPYLEINNCVERLQREYAKHNQLLISFDFDDTVFNYHAQEFNLEANATAHQQVLDLLRECKRRGFYLTIFTASVPSRYPMMLDYCEKLGITPHSINQNAVPDLPFGNHGKIYYNLLLDDRAGLSASVEILTKFLATLEPLPA